jgi:hypothetical protein
MREGPAADDTSAKARVRRALDVHGPRGLPFALARRTLTVLEDKLNPRHVNLYDFGYSEPFPHPVDPVAVLYDVEFQAPVLELPLSSFRWSRMGLRLDNPAANPFVRTVAEYHAGDVTAYEGSALQRYFDTWHPGNCGEVLGVGPHDGGTIAAQPPQAVVLPWHAEAGDADPVRRLDRVDRWNRAESRATGAEMGVAAGHKHFGPVSADLGRHEFARYRSLTDAVVSRGFIARVAEGYIGIQILVDGPSRAALTTGPGLHRAAVAAGLGIDPLTVSVHKHPPMVHRGDVDSWPGVRSGLFSRDSALRVFDRFIVGEPPSGFPTFAD